MKKPLFSVTVLALLAVGVFSVTCKFSFADDKRPAEGSLSFGARKKPEIKSSPHYQAFKNMFADVAEEVIPTVVSITSTKIDTVVYQDPFSQFFWGSPFEDFFGSPRQQRRRPQEQHIPKSGFGSGVIVSSDGYILTNYHVVGEADEIMVRMADEREFEATIVGIDSLSDVAVIKITEKVGDLPVAYLGDSDKLRPGDWSMAVGNPFNLSSTVTVGIVSAVGRSSVGVGTTQYRNFIQTDAAINPGNSGGALVNMDGELVGINTMIYTRSGGYMGIGFAIPINMAKWIMEELIYHGEVQRGWLGVQIRDLGGDMSEALGVGDRKGVLIDDVFQGQPADKAGMQVGDVVLSIDGVRTENANELMNTVASIKPGKTVPVEIIRNGKKNTLKVELAKRDEGKIASMERSGSGESKEEESSGRQKDYSERLGLKVAPITSEVSQQLQVDPATKGVYIAEVDPTSRAAREGLRKGDIIRKVRTKGSRMNNIETVKDFEKALKGVGDGDAVMFYIQRQGRSFFVAFKAQ
jgi:serine protease Do